MLIALALLQAAATPAPAPPVPQRFSILAEPCAPVPEKGRDVVVCGSDLASSQRLPLPDEAEPTVGYAKPDSMDYRDNKGDRHPCVVRGCQVGFGPPIMPAIIAGVKAIGNMRKDARWAAARKRDGARRVAIPLDAAPPAGRIER
jgi:hypothetical protein